MYRNCKENFSLRINSCSQLTCNFPQFQHSKSLLKRFYFFCEAIQASEFGSARENFIGALIYPKVFVL